MLETVHLSAFGPIRQLDWSGLGAINAVLGPNGSGKTFLLKAMYAARKTVETHGRGDNTSASQELLASKLKDTFKVDKLGELVNKSEPSRLNFKMSVSGEPFAFGFGRDTTSKIVELENGVVPTDVNSIFLPAKEVLSLQSVIIRSRRVDLSDVFDDTYLDLAEVLTLPPTRGKNHSIIADSRKDIEHLIGGKVAYDAVRREWSFRKGNQRHSIALTSEGIKKLSILDTLLGNRYLTVGSTVFIDEPESALHPDAITKFLDIVADLSMCGIQFFMATHSYFVIKKLHLISLKRKMSIPIAMEDSGAWSTADLKNGMPDNAIIDESIELYEAEVEQLMRS